ncbi:alpha/beta fold hydrolase [Roseobacter sinensis]|uniref:Alpha/beta hydrolase n=1 Tax=Roseobacter sinensis TaxID=2931391 RepID=A0ABT3B9P2_9RHOB|nr:alpha/beta hydrolase [Roseobacter sp. WL0113]MCV3270144.1 alpha/beta hydrolase [Roseobacter sp. WL0113]
MDSATVIWAAVAVVVALPFAVEALRKPMTAKARAEAPGAFTELSQGLTHYRWHGGGSGPVVVCVHGLTTPSFVWGGLAKGLTGMGFRVLVYDLYGRGYSDRPPGAQDHGFFQTQLNDLLADQGVEGEITLIGYSMGGAIAARFAAEQPERLRRLILLAPAGMEPVVTGLIAFAARTPVIGAWLMLARYPAILRRGLRAEAGQPSSVEEIGKLQAAELTWRGFIPAVRASLRGILSQVMQAEHRQLKAAKVPVLAVWGAEDAVISLQAAERLRDWNDRVRTVVIPGAGHGLPYTHTADVLAQVEAFSRDTA